MDELKRIKLISDYASYKPRYIIIRVLIISMVAVGLIILGRALSDFSLDIDPGMMSRIYLISILVFNTFFEVNLLIMNQFHRIRVLRYNFYLQALAIVLVSVALITLALLFFRKVLITEFIFKNRTIMVMVIIGLLIEIIHLLTIMISNFASEWLKSREEIEQLKQSKLLGDYNSLKDRLNPHFLFNNLSVLKSLINQNPSKAEIFTDNFTDVYRYVLNSHEKKTVSLKEEVNFLNSYLALHKERLGEGLSVSINIDSSLYETELPPLSLQLLVENAIKHNIASKTKPLEIEIYTEGLALVVRNNLNKKEITYSTQTGLSTLEAQYKLLSNTGLDISAGPAYYRVVLPLL